MSDTRFDCAVRATKKGLSKFGACKGGGPQVRDVLDKVTVEEKDGDDVAEQQKDKVVPEEKGAGARGAGQEADTDVGAGAGPGRGRGGAGRGRGRGHGGSASGPESAKKKFRAEIWRNMELPKMKSTVANLQKVAQSALQSCSQASLTIADLQQSAVDEMDVARPHLLTRRELASLEGDGEEVKQHAELLRAWLDEDLSSFPLHVSCHAEPWVQEYESLSPVARWLEKYTNMIENVKDDEEAKAYSAEIKAEAKLAGNLKSRASAKEASLRSGINTYVKGHEELIKQDSKHAGKEVSKEAAADAKPSVTSTPGSKQKVGSDSFWCSAEHIGAGNNVTIYADVADWKKAKLAAELDLDMPFAVRRVQEPCRARFNNAAIRPNIDYFETTLSSKFAKEWEACILHGACRESGPGGRAWSDFSGSAGPSGVYICRMGFARFPNTPAGHRPVRKCIHRRAQSFEYDQDRPPSRGLPGGLRKVMWASRRRALCVGGRSRVSATT